MINTVIKLRVDILGLSYFTKIYNVNPYLCFSNFSFLFYMNSVLKNKIFFIPLKHKSSLSIVSDNILKYIQIPIKTKYLDLTKIKIISEKYRPSFIKSLVFEFLLIRQALVDLFLIRNQSQEYVFFFESYFCYTHIVSLFTKKKKIILVHDLIYFNDYKLEKNFLSKLFKYIFYRFGRIRAMKNCDLILTISKKSVEELVKIGLDRSKIKYVYIGTDFKKIEAPNPYGDYILCVGSEQERKNMKSIIKSFALLKKDFPNLKLVKPSGGVSPSKRAITMSYIEKENLELEKDIVFIEKTNMNKLIQLYSNALLLMFPSFEEGFGLPIIEAQACGCPVITTNYKPMSEITAYEDLLVDPYDYDIIYQKAKKIIENPEYRKRKIEEGLQFSKQFTWKETSKNFEKVLHDFIASN